jgi:hypothetical protein
VLGHRLIPEVSLFRRPTSGLFLLFGPGIISQQAPNFRRNLWEKASLRTEEQQIAGCYFADIR